MTEIPIPEDVSNGVRDVNQPEYVSDGKLYITTYRTITTQSDDKTVKEEELTLRRALDLETGKVQEVKNWGTDAASARCVGTDDKYLYYYDWEARRLYSEDYEGKNPKTLFTWDEGFLVKYFYFDDEEAYAEYLQEIMNPRSMYAMIREGVELDTGDKLLTLSTCIANKPNNRRLLQAVLVEEIDAVYKGATDEPTE